MTAPTPVAVNRWVWPTEIVGLAGVTVMACAAASSFARTQTRVKTAKTTRTFAFLFIAEPSPRYGDLYDVGVSSGRGPSGGTLNHTGRDPLS